MGVCASSDEVLVKLEERNKRLKSVKIDKYLTKTNENVANHKKLLLVGAGGSGKSTFVKQLTNLYGRGYTAEEVQGFKTIIHQNIMSSVALILKHFFKSYWKQRADPEADIPDEGLKYLLKRVHTFKSTETLTPTDGKHIATLWKTDEAKEAWRSRNRINMLDNTSYYMKNLERITAEDYEPELQDTFYSRSRTEGILESQIQFKSIMATVIDVGGQRNQRRKWIHCFQDCTAVLFVAGISEFNEVLEEDGVSNKLLESINVFNEVINSEHLVQCAVVLLLNKIDLFRKKIKHDSIRSLFPDYPGDEQDFDEAAHYIGSVFSDKLGPEKIDDFFMHLTCATDTSSVEFTFQAIKNGVLSSGLSHGGAM